MKFEHLVFKHLLHDQIFVKKTLPFLKSEYFKDPKDKIIFEIIYNFIEKYKNSPTIEALGVELEKLPLEESEFEEACKVLNAIEGNSDSICNLDWMTNQTEIFCQDKAIYNAVLESINILDGKSQTLQKGAIPKILQEALSVSFDSNIGHDFVDDFESRFEYYHRVEERIPFDLKFFNLITKNGLPKGTLNLLVSGTNVGKTLAKCHFASHYLRIGKNVLYITLEMSEEEIAKRIDANLFDINIDEIENVPLEIFKKKIERLKNINNLGKLIIKQFPTASAGVVHFRNLIHELKLKKGFSPDIVIIDYMNIAISSRLKMGSSVNSYSLVKSIAEEFRGLAVELKVPILSATQFNRGGGSNSDPNIEDVSESHGTSMTADWMVALVSTEELEQLGQIMVKQIKSRYADKNIYKRFVIGVDRRKMRLYDLEDSAQEDIVDSGQPKEKLKQEENFVKGKFTKEKFKDFNF